MLLFDNYDRWPFDCRPPSSDNLEMRDVESLQMQLKTTKRLFKAGYNRSKPGNKKGVGAVMQRSSAAPVSTEPFVVGAAQKRSRVQLR